MKIRSARLGEIEIDPAKIITFPDGVIGFPDFKRYVELEFLENSPLTLLQAVDEPELGFIIIDPALFEPGYEAGVATELLEGLKTENVDDLAARVIVTIPEDPYGMTANLQGPIVINRKSGLARQIINHDSRYGTKHSIIRDKPAVSQGK